jgi:serine/threonine-protein kinase
MAAPTFIGRYEIVAELGRGAMGSVFKATDPAVGRTVALKTIHSAALNGAQAEEYRARFYREARASGVLAHPGIVPVFDVGENDGAPFLVMEFVEGRTLESAMKKGERFTLDRVCDIGQQLAEALGYAHRQGVIHRDVKPANILMTSREVYGSERPRITDFGIAKLAASEITTTGQLLGTPAFMPPEQFTGAPIDGRADLFSLGVILYSLASGEQPFPGETMTAVSYKVVHTDPIPPSKLNPSIPAGMEAVILKCLAKSPANRYQTGEELAHDLATLRANPNATLAAAAALAPAGSDPNATLAAVPASISHPPAQASAAAQKPPAVPARNASKQHKTETIIAAALLVVAAAGAGLWFYLHHRPQPAPPQPQAVVVPAPQPAAPAASPIVQGNVTPDQEPAAPAKPAPAQPAPAKPQAGAPKTTPPPATKPAPTPAPVPAPAPASKQPKTTPPPAPTPAAPAVDPHKLDPNANSKFKIELSKFPNGVPLMVEMNKTVYLRFISGDKTDLNNLYAPPGVQTFRVIAQNGPQQVISNIVSNEFKAKKKKNLKIELRNQGTVPAGASAPLTSGASIFISLSTPLF